MAALRRPDTNVVQIGCNCFLGGKTYSNPEQLESQEKKCLLPNRNLAIVLMRPLLDKRRFRFWDVPFPAGEQFVARGQISP
jgi:hypothetical protein